MELVAGGDIKRDGHVLDFTRLFVMVSLLALVSAVLLGARLGGAAPAGKTARAGKSKPGLWLGELRY